MTRYPFVTIVMPAYNEAAYIEACVDSILQQTYAADRMEVLVADGGSTDGTRSILERLAASDPRVRTIDNSEHRLQSYGMNACIQASRGTYILICDVHAEYARDYVAQIVDAFERTGADAVGGAQRAKGRSSFQRALCRALSSQLGVGGAAYRSSDNEGFVDTVFPGAYRRASLERVGLFDVKAATNEDADLTRRIIDHGGRVYLSRDVVVHYYPRPSLKALVRQYFKYGDGRSRTILLHGTPPSLRPMVPFLGLSAALALLLVPGLTPALPACVLLYAAATGIEAARVGHTEGAAAVPVVWAIFPSMHVAHGLGFLHGLVKYTFNPVPPEIEQLDSRPSVTA